jgi:hypothetical protein
VIRQITSKQKAYVCFSFHCTSNPTFCVLEELKTALKLRDVFVAPSWRYTDPRAGLFNGAEWEATRPIICRTLGLSAIPEPTLNAHAVGLDLTYHAVERVEQTGGWDFISQLL